MDTKDISSISKGSSIPVDASPTAFLGMTVQQVRDWFDANITQPERKGFLQRRVLVLDTHTYLFVYTLLQSLRLRCNFDVAKLSVTVCDINQSTEEGFGSFMRSVVIMTKANMEILMNGGMYIENGEVKVSQAWRNV